MAIAFANGAMSRPPRLDGFDYVGPAQYFLTFCTHERRRVFEDATVVDLVLTQFRRTCVIEHVAVLAYCLMPDHAHLLVEGMTADADLCRFVKMSKQRSGGKYARIFHQRLWQAGYHDRILRQEDDPFQVARYILNNPIRAGLVTRVQDYPHVGSDVWTLAELIGSLI